MQIRPMRAQDILEVSQVHREAFPRQDLSEEWITCNFTAYPRIRLFVAADNKQILGYIQWSEKSGFRKEVVLELEQIAVRPTYRLQCIGKQLILQTLAVVQKELENRQACIKHILISTRADNKAQKLYSKILKALPEVVIADLFSGDEVLMISRNLVVL